MLRIAASRSDLRFDVKRLALDSRHAAYPDAGDMVIATHPDEPYKAVVKRIVACAGELVHSPILYDAGVGCHIERLVEVPAGHVWLSGDDLRTSTDSRLYGPVPYQLLLGKPVATVRELLI
jgi:mitochondrial inner membrane protease subunit 1